MGLLECCHTGCVQSLQTLAFIHEIRSRSYVPWADKFPSEFIETRIDNGFSNLNTDFGLNINPSQLFLMARAWMVLQVLLIAKNREMPTLSCITRRVKHDVLGNRVLLESVMA